LSAELQTLTSLEKEAVEIQRKAKIQEQKLNKLFSEWSGLPARAEAYRARIAEVAAQRKALGPELDLEFEVCYEQLVSGNLAFTAKTDALNARIATRDLRLKLLKGFESDAIAQLEKLDVRNCELSKVLACPKHRLTDKALPSASFTKHEV
jgi:hypothetical protein